MNNLKVKIHDECLEYESDIWDYVGEQAKRIYNRLKETFGRERSEMDGKF